MNFTAIDFETANEKRGSIIQVGLSRVEDGQVVETAVEPISLPASLYRFSPRCVAIHGLTSSYIAGARGWPEILEFILDFAAKPTHLVAHNASVERACIEQASEAWGIAAPPIQWLDTMALAKTHVPQISPGYAAGYGLEPLAGHFGLPSFAHHDAGADAEATALLALSIRERLGLDQADVHQLWARAGALKPRTQADRSAARYAR